MPKRTPPARQIEYVPLLKLRELGDPVNPRAHESLGDVQDSIEEHGFIDLIVTDSRTGLLVSGHGRVKVLTQLEQTQAQPPEGVVVDAGTGEWLVPVVTGWSSRDDDQARRALLVLNRATETSGWDDGALLQLLDELSGAEAGLAATGFQQEDYERLQRVVEASQGALDAQAEWDAAGMPEYDSRNLQSAYRTVVHFSTDRDADEFFKLMGRDRARFMWWPESDGHRGVHSDVQVVSDADGA